MDKIPKRKPMRLKNFDYSLDGAYFITICSKDRKQIFSKVIKSTDNVGANIVRLLPIGKIVEENINNIEAVYPCVKIINYIIMPNHIHMILSIDTNGQTMFAPTVARVIKQFKGVVSKQVGFPVWQRNFYDHIIRNENDLEEKMNYIFFNAQKWEEDEYYENERKEKYYAMGI